MDKCVFNYFPIKLTFAKISHSSRWPKFVFFGKVVEKIVIDICSVTTVNNA